MQAIIEALQGAGFQVESTTTDGEHVELTVIKDDIRQRFATSPSLTPAGIDEMLAQVVSTYYRKLLGP